MEAAEVIWRVVKVHKRLWQEIQGGRLNTYLGPMLGYWTALSLKRELVSIILRQLMVQVGY